MNRIIISFLIVSIILISGCITSTEPIEPVDPNNVAVDTVPFVIKEFQEQDISVSISNNATVPIDSVTVTSLEPFTVLDSAFVNIPGKKDKPVETSIDVHIKAPNFKTDAGNSTLIVSYASGRDKKGNPMISTKTAPVEATILPDAKLESFGFVKDMQSLLDPRMAMWELSKGEKVAISFHVKNYGQTTIDENTLIVRYVVENTRIGGDGTLTIPEAMAKGGTSYTRGLEIPILEDAPNGETDVYLTLLMNDHVIDTQKLVLKVIL